MDINFLRAKKEKYYEKLTDLEVKNIEEIVEESFEDKAQ